MRKNVLYLQDLSEGIKVLIENDNKYPDFNDAKAATMREMAKRLKKKVDK